MEGFSILAMPQRAAPSITSYPLDYLADVPAEVRWRAAWKKTYEGDAIGIELRCYPVTKATPQGAWIDEHAYHHGEWHLSGNTRWVSNTGGQAWAKPTRAAALESIAIRYQRWASRMHRDINFFRAAGQTMAVLVPERTAMVNDMLHLVAATARDLEPRP